MPDVDKSAPLPQGERYPVIESVASDFDVFLSSLPELMGRANDLLERVGRVFSDENLNGLAETVKSLRAATAGLPQTSQNVAQLVDELRAHREGDRRARRSRCAASPRTRVRK